MQAVVIAQHGGPEVLQVQELPRPEAGAGEVLIRVEAAGVNRADVVQRMGLYPPPPGASEIPGLEVAGTVAALGEGVEQWAVGDRVCALLAGGGYAEYAVAAAAECLPVPAGLSMSQAAGLPETVLTVWSNVMDRCALKPGETFLVHGGSSGVGTTAIQLAVRFGATAYATAGSDEKVRVCEELGATRAVNYREQDFLEILREETGGRGVDVILDMVGGNYVDRNIQLAAIDGRIVNIAYLQGSQVEANLMPLMLKRLVLTGSTLRAREPSFKSALTSAVRAAAWPWIEAGEVRPVIHREFPFSEAAEAHRLMESSAHIGKLILRMT
jgi:putative PIG3 family NAD(P)H quinone oxidoreductase